MVRGILFEKSGDLVFIKRVKPNQKAYYVFVGGGVEPSDESFEDALVREVFEELGGQVKLIKNLFSIQPNPADNIESTQHFFLGYLISINLAARTGKEFNLPDRGTYEVFYAPPTKSAVVALNILPLQAKDFLLENITDLIQSINSTSKP